MSKPKYFLVSLPTSISPSNDRDEALTALRSSVQTDAGTTVPFAIPSFKIGTLDPLVQQADDLAKLESTCEGVVSKVAESLRSILEGDEEKIAEQKNVNDSMAEQFMVLIPYTNQFVRACGQLSANIRVEQSQISCR